MQDTSRSEPPPDEQDPPLELTTQEHAAIADSSRQADERLAAVESSCANTIAQWFSRQERGGSASMSLDDSADVRACVCDFIAALRATGLTAEAAIIRLKRLVATAAQGSRLPHRKVTEVLVAYAIDCYYAPP